MRPDPRVAVVGATGAVGREILLTLEQLEFPASKVAAFASAKSAGSTVPYKGADLIVEELRQGALDDYDIALFSAGGSTSAEFAPGAAKAGCVVIDNSSAFRMDPEVPLVVPEVNPQAIGSHKGIIANPNCSTIQMVVALKPLHDISRITRIIVSTYQAVSGTGAKAIEELTEQSRAVLDGDDAVSPHVYPHRIAFNVLPHIDLFEASGFTKEEVKMVNETRKILGDGTIRINATAARVPVFRGHSESVYIETEAHIGADKARQAMREAPGVLLVDEPETASYPMPVAAAGGDLTLVGRIRDDLDVPNGLSLWVVADNLRKGAALNAVQIARALL